MVPALEFNHEKATQAVNFFAAQQPDGQINKLKAIKLVWLADRYHLRRYGRPITNDQYWAMPYGPVGSSAKDLAEQSAFLSEREQAYASAYLEPIGRYEVKSTAPPDLTVFSQTDIEALRFAWNTFGDRTEFELAELSHRYPEWRRFQSPLESQETSRELMSYADFFGDPGDQPDDPFRDEPERLEAAKAIFEEDLVVASHWS